MEADAPLAAANRRSADERLAARRRDPARPADTPLVWVAAASGVGLIGSWSVGAAGWRPEWLVPLAAATLAGWAVAWRRRDDRAAYALLAAIALVAAAWAGAGWRLFRADDLGRFARLDAEPVCFEATAASPPVVYPASPPSPFRAIPPSDRTVLELKVDRLRDSREWRPASGRCELSVLGRLEGVRAGDRLRVYGQLRRPTPARNPGERDAAAADRAERRLAVVWTEAPDCVTPLGGDEPAAAFRAAAAARAWSLERIQRRMPERAGVLVRAMLLGDASQLPDATVEAFRLTGTLHVLVVSGLHVGLAAGLFPALAAFGLAPRRLAWACGLLLVVAYVVVAGARPPAVRAGVVAASLCLAGLAGRRALSVNSLAGGAVAVFAASPGAWLGVGTQLSFLAACTLLGIGSHIARRRARVTPPLERLIAACRTPRERATRRLAAWASWGLGATLAVQLAAGPLVASTFHLVSPAAAPLALAVSPLIAITVGAGLATLTFDAAWLGPLAAVAGRVSGGAASGLAWLVQAAADSPLSAWWVAGPPAWWTAAWLAWCGLIAAGWAYGWPLRRLVLQGGLALLAVWFAPPVWRTLAESGELRCSFVAVGHGSATLLEPPGGGAVLVDAGALGSPDRATDTIARVLWSRGVTRLDAVVLTHPDLDHYNALPGLLERFEIAQVLTTTQMFPRFIDPLDRSGPAELARLLEASGVPVREVAFGDRFRIGEATARVMHPDRVGVVGSDNANSLVLGIEHAGRRMLLPGDLESAGVENLLAQEAYDCGVLLAPHHGSRLSNPPGFAAWCRPETVVISSGASRGEANAAYAATGAAVYSTHRHGMVTARLSRDALTVTRYGGADSP